MNLKQVALVSAMTLVVVAGCGNTVAGNGDVIEKSRLVKSSIREIVVQSAMKVKINQGKKDVRVRGDSNLLDYVETTQVDGVLTIKLQPNTSISNCTLEAFVSAENLEQVRVSGASRVQLDYKSKGNIKVRLSGASRLTGFLQTVDMEIDVSGGSLVDLQSDLKSVTASVSGASKVYLPGVIGEIVLDVSGASTVNLLRSRVDHVDAQTVSGASRVKLPALQMLELKHVSGASTVTYKGKPTVTLESITGASTVKRED